VRRIGDFLISTPQVNVKNPAFDVTPARFVPAIITERGIAFPPFEESLEALRGSP